jgi:hypothetical protein
MSPDFTWSSCPTSTFLSRNATTLSRYTHLNCSWSSIQNICSFSAGHDSPWKDCAPSREFMAIRNGQKPQTGKK